MLKPASMVAAIALILVTQFSCPAHADETWTINWNRRVGGSSENHSGTFTATISSDKQITLSGSCPDLIIRHGEHNYSNTRLRAVDCSAAFDARVHFLQTNRVSFEYSMAPACPASYDDTFEFDLTNGDVQQAFYTWSSWKDFFGHCTRALREDRATGLANGSK